MIKKDAYEQVQALLILIAAEQWLLTCSRREPIYTTTGIALVCIKCYSTKITPKIGVETKSEIQEKEK